MKHILVITCSSPSSYSGEHINWNTEEPCFTPFLSLQDPLKFPEIDINILESLWYKRTLPQGNQEKLVNLITKLPSYFSSRVRAPVGFCNAQGRPLVTASASEQLISFSLV